MAQETPTTKRDEWFKDFSRCGPLPVVVIIAIIAIIVGFLLPVLANLKSMTNRQQVVIYASQDQVYAEPILKDFEKETGIKVRAVFDSEAIKTVGLANRLLAERNHPQCDVFWNNEELRTRQLAEQNVFRPTNGWARIGYRSRRVVVNTDKLPLASAPRSLHELTNTAWHGKIALAYPLFGTTATHFLALRQFWGAERWLAWCQALHANQPFLVDGNSVAVKLVGKGEAWLGLTDSDDIAAEAREGAPISPLPLTDESLLIANTVAVIRNTPNPHNAQLLFDYLQQPVIAQRLIQANALEGAGPDSRSVKTLDPDWPRILQNLEPATASLQQIFLR